MVREAAAGPLVAPTPELPDDMPIERVLFSTRIQNALRAADLKTVGEVRETSDETLISLPDFARGSLSDLRMKLGLPSTDGVSRSACRAGLELNRAECGAHLIVFEPMGDIQCCSIWDSTGRGLSARQRGSEWTSKAMVISANTETRKTVRMLMQPCWRTHAEVIRACVSSVR